MRFNDAPMDINKGIRRPAGFGEDTYLQIHTLPVITVGVAPMRLTPQRTPAFLIMPQASNANGGTICIGGPEVTIANGIEMTGGLAVLFASLPTPQQLMGGMGFGMMPQIAPSTPLVVSFLLFDMYDIWVVATAPLQTLRVMYMAAPRR